jgi:hypothetical protein
MSFSSVEQSWSHLMKISTLIIMYAIFHASTEMEFQTWFICENSTWAIYKPILNRI